MDTGTGSEFLMEFLCASKFENLVFQQFSTFHIYSQCTAQCVSQRQTIYTGVVLWDYNGAKKIPTASFLLSLLWLNTIVLQLTTVFSRVTSAVIGLYSLGEIGSPEAWNRLGLCVYTPVMFAQQWNHLRMRLSVYLYCCISFLWDLAKNALLWLSPSGLFSTGASLMSC